MDLHSDHWRENGSCSGTALGVQRRDVFRNRLVAQLVSFDHRANVLSPICHNFLTMCGRYRLARRKQVVEEYFDSVSGEEDWAPRYNIAPSQPVPVIRQNPKEPIRELSLMRWGLIPSWTLLANPHMTHCPSRTKAEERVSAGGTPLQWSVSRCRLIAHAIAIFCKCVFCNPRYLDRRSPTERTPCEKVPSIPARLLYSSFHSGVRCSILLAASNSDSSRRRRVSFLGFFAPFVVQR